MENSAVFKKVEHGASAFYIQASIDQNSLNIIILQNSNAWKSVANNEASNVLEQSHLDLITYNRKVFNYIENTPPAITFFFNEQEFVIHHQVNDYSKIKFFTCPLEPVNYNDCIETMLLSFYKENVQLHKDFKQLKNQTEQATTNKTEFDDAFEQYIKRHKKERQQLFNNFALILNEKKLHIQHLTEQLEACQSGTLPLKVVQKKKRKITRNAPAVKKKEVVSESDTDSNSSASYETDEEQESIKRKRVEPEETNEETSTSHNFLDDNVPELDVVHLQRPTVAEAQKDSSVPDCSNESKSKLAQSHPKQDKDDQEPTTTKNLPPIEYSSQELIDMI